MTNPRHVPTPVGFAFLAMIVLAANAGGQGGAPLQAEVRYDRFTDSTSVRASADFAFPTTYADERPDSITIGLNVGFAGKTAAQNLSARLVLLHQTKRISRPIPTIDSTASVFLLADGKVRIAAKPASYSATYLEMLVELIEIASYRLTYDELKRLANSRTVEARLGVGREVLDADKIAKIAAAVVAAIPR